VRQQDEATAVYTKTWACFSERVRVAVAFINALTPNDRPYRGQNLRAQHASKKRSSNKQTGVMDGQLQEPIHQLRDYHLCSVSDIYLRAKRLAAVQLCSCAAQHIISDDPRFACVPDRQRRKRGFSVRERARIYGLLEIGKI
jgi:hypothetical protein